MDIRNFTRKSPGKFGICAGRKKKGMWMGGVPPLGYKSENKKLVIVPEEAETARQIFRRYLELGCVRKLNENLEEDRIQSRTGKPFSRGCLYKLLSNPVYIGQIRHKDICHDGQRQKAATAQSRELSSVADRAEALEKIVQHVDLSRDRMRLTLLLVSMTGQGDRQDTFFFPLSHVRFLFRFSAGAWK